MNNKKLKKAREKAGITQIKLAKKVDITLVSYQRFEYGTRRPSLNTAIKIAEVLETTVEELFKDI